MNNKSEVGNLTRQALSGGQKSEDRKMRSYEDRKIKLLNFSYSQLLMFSLLLLTAYCLLLTFIPCYTSAQESPPLIQPAPPHAKIGVILPLSGRYAQFGEQALKGIWLAAGIFEKEGIGAQSDGKVADIEIVIKDTRDDPRLSERGVEELASDDGVVGILGPLLSIVAPDAAKKAQELNVPVITLSQREGLTGIGEYVFRKFLTPSEQAKVIADYAINRLKYKRFAMLYPSSPYGMELANLFKEEIKNRKGEILAEEQYKEGQTYFGKEIARLFKIKESEKKEGRRQIKTFTAALTADALYIPDYFDTIGLIVPHLAYYNIKDVKLLGSNGWNSPRLIEMAGKYVEGAVFVDGFFAGSQRWATREFVNEFKSVYGTEPGIIEAQAYDAAKMMIEAIKGSQQSALGSQRENIRNSLVNLKDFPGATGDVTFDSNREALNDLFILTVKGGRIMEVK